MRKPPAAGRMDSYVASFMAAGGSMVTLAKGNRSKVCNRTKRTQALHADITTCNALQCSSSRLVMQACPEALVVLSPRVQVVTEACKKYGGFYLGSIGGPAAILAQNCIKKVRLCWTWECWTPKHCYLFGSDPHLPNLSRPWRLRLHADCFLRTCLNATGGRAGVPGAGYGGSVED